MKMKTDEVIPQCQDPWEYISYHQMYSSLRVEGRREFDSTYSLDILLYSHDSLRF